MTQRALIFAAGRGERMRPLTDATPKPLLAAGGRRLVEWHLDKLARAGVREVVINTSHLADRFPEALGDGRRYGLALRYVYEGETPLETGGGMLNALPLLGAAPFLVVNGDVWTDADFSTLPGSTDAAAHLLLVANPDHHRGGDFVLGADSSVRMPAAAPQAAALTYAGIGLFSPRLFARWRDDLAAQNVTLDGSAPPRFAIVHLLRAAIARGEVTGSRLVGDWVDVGTPARLEALDARLRSGG